MSENAEGVGLEGRPNKLFLELSADANAEGYVDSLRVLVLYVESSRLTVGRKGYGWLMLSVRVSGALLSSLLFL